MRNLALLLLAGCGLFQAGMGMYFVASNPASVRDGKRFVAGAFNPFAALR